MILRTAPEWRDEEEFNECGHDRAQPHHVECPECGADLSALNEEN